LPFGSEYTTVSSDGQTRARPALAVATTIVSAVAQLERDLIRERVSAGIRNARACGKHLGRPRRVINHDDALRLRSERASLRQIAAKLGVGYGTVRLRLRNS